jgi:hypothetical protein
LLSEDPAPTRRHSTIGLVSVGVAIATALMSLLLFVLYLIPESGTYTEQRLSRILAIFSFLVAPVLYLAGLILGIVGALKKDTKKRVAVAGIVFNGLPLVFSVVCVLLLLWLAAAVVLSGGGWR